MSINWFTLAAQILNFLVLVWLLKRFLYGPIIHAMEEREARIAARIHEADEARREADQQQADYRQKMQELEHTREQLLAEAATDVEEWRTQHVKQACIEVDADRADWYRSLAREKASLIQNLRLQAAAQVQQVARHVLAELSTEELERQAIAVFLTRLSDLDPDQKAEIALAIRNSHHHVFVESGFDLPERERRRITEILQQELTDGLDVEFRTQAELICGIELQAAGYKVCWSIREALESLDEKFVQAIEETMTFTSSEGRAPEMQGHE